MGFCLHFIDEGFIRDYFLLYTSIKLLSWGNEVFEFAAIGCLFFFFEFIKEDRQWSHKFSLSVNVPLMKFSTISSDGLLGAPA